MIEISYHRGRHEISARGHAGYDEPGKDIVCAAVTALMTTLAQFAKESGEAEIRLEPGDILVRCQPRRRYGGPVALVYSAIAGGLCGIALQYPEHVKFERYA